MALLPDRHHVLFLIQKHYEGQVRDILPDETFTGHEISVTQKIMLKYAWFRAAVYYPSKTPHTSCNFEKSLLIARSSCVPNFIQIREVDM
ncbi:hypothetical protein L596_010584 [Steinernema carpocapsae]|uniref:Uncharacterized protein n=1 Tax=Steinernema carpocapsae TaxID=34508 RepID=A0A4U5PJ97_STECR|nr:hypothetical protein L596_010584 [Steinernema carpocapsae]